MNSQVMLCRPAAILFDMDGTLTIPRLDFPRIKAEMGIGDQPILESLALMPAQRRAAVELILHRHEDETAAHDELVPGCRELLAWLRRQGIGVALVTRNRRQSVDTFLHRHRLPIEVLITREDGPHKPDPASLLLACRRLCISPANAWMVGDGSFDVEAAIAAGMPSIWVSLGRERTFSAEPTRTIDSLGELQTLLMSGKSGLMHDGKLL